MRTSKPHMLKSRLGLSLRVDRHEAVLPVDGGDRARQAVLDVPERRAAEVDVVLHQAHARVARPALLVVVADNVLVVRIRVLRQVALDQVARLLCGETEQDVELVDVARVQADRVPRLACGEVAEGEEVVGRLAGDPPSSERARCRPSTEAGRAPEP